MSLLFAQCVMCFRTAAAQQGARSQVMNRGILVMMVPPLCIMALLVYLAWKKNHPTNPSSNHISAPPNNPPDVRLNTKSSRSA